MYKIGFLLPCLAAIVTASSPCDEQSLEEFAEGNQKFSADVVKSVFKDQHNKGIISPLSAEIVLALVAEGANGETYEELQRALNLPDKDKTTSAIKALFPILNKSTQNFNLSLADKLYIDKKFKVKESFKNIAVSAYQSEVENVNFAENKKTVRLINEWVEKKTNNKIQNLVSADQLDASTALVLVNALYMNAKWQTPFPAQRTTKKPFYYLSKKVEDVDTMHSADNARYLYFHCGFLKAKFLEIPYKDSNVSATFILPDAKDGLVDLEKNVELYLKPHNLTSQRVAVSLPKFSATTYHDFKEILEKLGVSKVFESDADLSGISDDKKLFINFVQQKAFINITEIGTEAAAATAVGLTPTAIVQPPDLTFNADHPFFYYIRESISKVILFVGRYQ